MNRQCSDRDQIDHQRRLVLGSGARYAITAVAGATAAVCGPAEAGAPLLLWLWRKAFSGTIAKEMMRGVAYTGAKMIQYGGRSAVTAAGGWSWGTTLAAGAAGAMVLGTGVELLKYFRPDLLERVRQKTNPDFVLSSSAPPQERRVELGFASPVAHDVNLHTGVLAVPRDALLAQDPNARPIALMGTQKHWRSGETPVTAGALSLPTQDGTFVLVPYSVDINRRAVFAAEGDLPAAIVQFTR